MQVDPLLKTLQKKFISTVSTNFTNVPVSSALPAFLQSQSQKITCILNRKQQVNKNIQAMASNRLKNRQQLQEKIIKSQAKHAKNRKLQMEAIVKRQKFKTEYVNQINKKHNQKQAAKKKMLRQNFMKKKQQMIEFWNQQNQLKKKTMRIQSRAKSVYQLAVNKKKQIQQHQIEYSEIVKDQLLLRHQLINDRIKKIIDHKKQTIHQPHCRTIQNNLKKNQQIMNFKNNHFINSIGLHMSKSLNVMKNNSSTLKKKIQNNIIDRQYKTANAKTRLLSKGKELIKKNIECQCWCKGNQQIKSRSVLVNTQERGFQPKHYNKLRQSLMMNNRANFINKSLLTLSKVMSQKDIIQQNKELQDQKRLMKEKQISDALKLKHQIQTEANSLIRKLKIIS